jgi:signal transduction histidine kinase
MSETKNATRGRWPTTRPGPRVGVRVASLAVAAVVGAALIIGLTRITWQRVDQLQVKLATLHPESFAAGVRIQSGIRRINDTLLRYRLLTQDSDGDKFRTEAGGLLQWIQKRADQETNPLESAFLHQIDAAYWDYYTNSLAILNAPKPLLGRAGAFQTSYRRVDEQSTTLLGLCETFIQSQQKAFDQFVVQTNDTLAGFQEMLRASVLLVLVLGAVLVGLVYRDMIAPLRHQLSESQAIIERQEKLASLGVLSAGLAHEIRNPLTAIRFRLFSLNKLLPSSEAAEDAAVISNEITRLERILEDFLRFARPAEPERVGVPAQRLLQETYDLMREPLQDAGITLDLRPGEPLWVDVDTAQIKQVLINLLKNAAESMEHGGAITLHAQTERHGISSRQPAVALEVSDTGRGIPPDVQKRLFDPFFTTKESGTGLGLPIAARIVEKHGGVIRYRTHAGQGTLFKVVLPQYRNHESQYSAN